MLSIRIVNLGLLSSCSFSVIHLVMCPENGGKESCLVSYSLTTLFLFDIGVVFILTKFGYAKWLARLYK